MISDLAVKVQLAVDDLSRQVAVLQTQLEATKLMRDDAIRDLAALQPLIEVQTAAKAANGV